MPSSFSCLGCVLFAYFAFLYVRSCESLFNQLCSLPSDLDSPVVCLSPAPRSLWLAFVTEHYSPIWGMIISWLASEVLFPEAPLCAKSSHSIDMWTSSSWWNAIVMNKWGIASAVGPWTKRTLPSWHANAESCSLPVLPVGPSWKCEEMHIQTSAFWGG